MKPLDHKYFTHRNLAFSFLLGCVFTSTLTGIATAATIYSQTQPGDPNASFASSNIVNDQKIADNFLVSGTGQYTIRSLRVIGTYGTIGNPPVPLPDEPDDDFRIVFLDDDMGSPSMPVSGGDFSISSAVLRTPTGGQLLNATGRPIEFILDLGAGVTLDRGTEYWISVSNNPLPGSGWAWARANNVHDSQLASTTGDVATGSWTVGATSGMFFELSDENIPEPTSFILSLMALTQLVLIRCRKCRINRFAF